jgi:amino acid adenylation domain-containing protein
MTPELALHFGVDESARQRGDAVAVETAEGAMLSYRELAALSDRVRDRLWKMGARPGERIGVCLPKSIDAVAVILGVLKTGAAYVPCDPSAPPARNAYILANCGVKTAVVEQRLANALQPELALLGFSPPLFSPQGAGDGSSLAAALDIEQARDAASPVETWPSAPEDVAYILYTSGSTGHPKGVILTHRNATSFVSWCAETFAPDADERFSSHAPFHFDLSILDLYLPFQCGAEVVLIGPELGRDPVRLAALIAERRITSWYSTPTVLTMLHEFGRLASRDYPALRRVLFAGEVFPVRHLRPVQAAMPHARFFNLYGPTETNVCTFHEIPSSISPERAEPFPIGRVCSHLRGRVVDSEGRDVARGVAGELFIAGPAVTQGYWNLPSQTAGAFLNREAGVSWYRTGDLVVEDAEGDLIYRGRRDRMVKKRGYRVELGEIEACLYHHPDIHQAAAIAVEGPDGLLVRAFVCPRSGRRLSQVALKAFCAQNLPLYMVPDQFEVRTSLPMTSTDKVDYQSLRSNVAAEASVEHPRPAK